MFRHKNLRDDIGESILYSDRLDEPVNWPDNPLFNTNFVFIHGYNVNELQAQGWHAEFFKKLFWAGSRARFHAITWYGSDSQNFWPYYGYKAPDYHGNVLHAFQTAPLLEDYLNALGGNVILAAHSLGNMVACETVRLAPANVSLYFMLNAAVASESIDPAQYEENMLHKNWLPYEGLTDLYASEWYRRFENTPGDKRADLTWRGRFSAPAIVSKVINLYSSGDQVFEGQDKDEYPGVDQGFTNLKSGRYSWALQEKRKGERDLPGGTDKTYSHYAGWSFNFSKTSGDGWSKPYENTDWYRKYERQEVIDEIINDDPSVLKTKPFFGMGEEPFTILFEEDMGTANAFLSQEEYGASNIHRVIAGTIPAMSLAAGRTEMINGIFGEKDMNVSGSDALKPDFWPYCGDKNWQQYNWLHSDIKNMAYLYTNRVYIYLVEQGGLR